MKESNVMAISLGNKKHAPWTGMEDSLEASEWRSDDGCLGRREEGKKGWRRSGTDIVPEKHFAVKLCSSRPFIGWNTMIEQRIVGLRRAKIHHNR